MTRINANIKPEMLIDQHLRAEYREMVRIPNAVIKMGERVLTKKIPAEFRLGTGHVIFFYNKLKFLHRRFNALRDEMNRRGFKTNMDDEMFRHDSLYKHLAYGDLDPLELTQANKLVVERIISNIQNTMKTRPTLNRVPIDTEQYFDNLRFTYNCQVEAPVEPKPAVPRLLDC